MPSKGLQIQIVGADGETVISVVRNVSIMLMRVNSIQSVSRRLTLAELANYTEDYELNGGGLVCFEPLDAMMWEHIYPELLTYAPVAVPAFFDATGLAEYRIKLVAASGYYAISQQYTSPVTSVSFALYRDDGTQIGSSAFRTSLIMGAFNNVNTATVRAFQVVLDGDNIVNIGTITTSYGWQLPGNGINIGTIYNSTERENIIEWLNGITSEYPEIPDPYEPGGISGPGGGTGTFDGTGDLIPIPPLPTLSAINTGFVTLYVPTTQQLKALSDYMWNADLATLDFWKKLVADPIDLILGLNIVPVAAHLAGTKSVTVGFIDTDVPMYYTDIQYVEVDCGTLNIEEYWGAYLDYSPYTKAEIYLPYCGYHAIDIDDIMGKSVRVVYHVDILSGAVCAFVQCGGSVLYQFNGNCAAEIPVTSSQFGDMIMSAMSIAATFAGLPAASSDIAAAGAAHAAGKWGGATTKEMGLAASADTLSSIAGNVMKSKPNIARSGVIGSMGGQLAGQTPYLVITRPKQSIPENQNHFKGYPSNITAKLDTLKGYTVIDSVHLENIPCTLDEQREIDSILKTGVIF